MVYYKQNDYEILSLIQEGNQEALSLMFTKYKPLIYKKIYQFNLAYEKEDMCQEALMILFKSIRKFDLSQNKSFTKFFSMNLERKFISIVTKRVRRQKIMEENMEYIAEQNHIRGLNDNYYKLYENEIAKVLTKNEFLVYTLRELQNYSIAYISSKYQINEKVVYNSLYRAKKKIKQHFANELDKGNQIC